MNDTAMKGSSRPLRGAEKEYDCTSDTGIAIIQPYNFLLDKMMQRERDLAEMKKLLAALLAMSVSMLSGSAAQAISLQDLFNGGTITVGNLRFFNWAPLNSYGNVDPPSIEVAADNTDPHNPGIVYSTLDGSPIIHAEDIEGWYLNSYFFFTFSVQALDQLVLLNTDTFSMESGEVLVDDPEDSDSILITENVADGSLNVLAEKQLLCASPGFVPGTVDCAGVSDVVEFTPQSVINVTTYLEVDGRASLYAFSQHFSLYPLSPPFRNHGDCVSACVQDLGVLYDKTCSNLCKAGRYGAVQGAIPRGDPCDPANDLCAAPLLCQESRSHSGGHVCQ